ncbi:hypothetical protein BdWA1_001507 [Babesia duncani]|uniref:Uncharacterized protein n=1 Tax=Babesia duncani TaxID=323732 RepID=A0AAD9PJZ6_9APIC|nr:hypothetical protein BdWA1_001507 [Babesia duncani]
MNFMWFISITVVIFNAFHGVISAKPYFTEHPESTNVLYITADVTKKLNRLYAKKLVDEFFDWLKEVCSLDFSIKETLIDVFNKDFLLRYGGDAIQILPECKEQIAISKAHYISLSEKIQNIILKGDLNGFYESAETMGKWLESLDTDQRCSLKKILTSIHESIPKLQDTKSVELFKQGLQDVKTPLFNTIKEFEVFPEKLGHLRIMKLNPILLKRTLCLLYNYLWALYFCKGVFVKDMEMDIENMMQTLPFRYNELRGNN